MKTILTIAGSDSFGGAGIQADIRTILSLGAHALTAIAALTAQNSFGILGIHRVPTAFLEKQIESVLADITPDAVKIGMIFSTSNIRRTAAILKRHSLRNVVLDPVLKASTGAPLIEPGGLPVLKKDLLPLVSVVTPNLAEASILSGKRVETLADMEDAARVIKKMGPDCVVTGGHLKAACIDLLHDGKEMVRFRSDRIATPHTHGTGCVFSTALATFLASTNDLKTAVEQAHEFTNGAIRRGYACGRGAGPVSP